MPKVPQGIYFNDNNSYTCKWLENLWPSSKVDCQSIINITRDHVKDYRRVHLFAGIGGWEYALQLANWPNNLPVWTGSCPCQPFSVAGKRKGESDARHLWPEMFRLIQECRPPTIFGEQVAGKLGLEWFAGVRTNLEGIGYAVGGADLPAACVGAPHIRQRLFWVAHSHGNEFDDTFREPIAEVARGKNYSEYPERRGASKPSRTGISEPWNSWLEVQSRDGKTRRIPGVKQGIFPLAPRVSGTVEQIRAYGNAVVPQVAAVFIRSYLETKTPR